MTQKNYQEIIRSVYDESNNQLRTTASAGNSTVFIGTPTIYAVVNTGGSSANVTLNPSPNFIGIVTVANSQANTGNVTLNPSANFIGLVTANISNAVGNATLNPSPNFIGLTTTVVSSLPTVYLGTPTIYAVVNTGGSAANVTLNPSPNFIGIVTVANASSIGGGVQYTEGDTDATITGTALMFESNPGTNAISVVATDNPLPIDVTNAALAVEAQGPASVDGPDATQFNPVLSGGRSSSAAPADTSDDNDIQMFWLTRKGALNVADAGGSLTVDGTVSVGTPTVFIGTPTLYAVVNTGGSAANVTLNPSPNFIGIVTIANPSSFSGNITLDAGSKTGIVGNVTLSDAKTYVGLTTSTIGNTPTVFVGTPTLYAVVNTGAAGDPKTYIGLVTATLDNSRGVSVTGNVTLTDSKLYIGLTTSTLGVSDRFVGLVTVVQSSAVRSIVGNITITDSKGFIGLVTATSIQGTSPWVSSILGNITLSDPKTFIGLTTTILGNNSVQAFGQFYPTLQSIASGGLGPVALDNFGRVQTKITADPNIYIGLVTVDIGASKGITWSGNVTLSDAKTNIGLVTLTGGTAWSDPKTYIGLVTATLDNSRGISVLGNITISDSKSFIGLVTTQAADPKGYIGLVTVTQASSARSITGNITLSDSKTFIGLVSVGGGILNTITAVTDITNPVALKGSVTLADSKTYIGLTTSTLGIGTQFIGLVTANSINVGTNKVIVQLPIGLGANSLSTVAVPTNAQRIKVTSLILNSNVTTEIALKSGVTYLTGNASLGITLFPGGGFVLPGAPDSPQWISLPSGALVVEKRDPGGTVSKVAGHAIYFDEA